MKRICSFLVVLTMLCNLCILQGNVSHAQEAGSTSIGNTYYVDSLSGDDSNTGTSMTTPWKSLTKVSTTTFQPGDTILLKAGSVWNGEQLWPKGSGAENAPIKIDMYGDGAKPLINGMGVDRGFTYSGAVHLRNQEYWEIRNLEVTNDDDFNVDIDMSRPQGDNSWSGKNYTRNGILLIVDGDQLASGDDGIMDHIYIENCYVHDVDGPNDWNDTFTGGIIYNVVGSTIRPSTSFRDLRIAYNTIKKVDLLGITGFVEMAKKGYQEEIGTYNLWMRDVYIGHNYMEDIGQGAIDLCDAMNATVEYNVVNGFLERYPTFRPTVALYPWKTENAVFQFNEVYNGPSTNADGSPYDMDSGLKDVVYQFNYSHNNPCGWMLYMGKNYNDIIRYNISDDGGDFIIKYFLTANYSPAYFVNNVIMYDGAVTKFMHRDPFKSQTYFYNNVFYNKSTTTTTTWHDNATYLSNLGAVTFKNNCFYEASGIHSQYEPADPNKITSNPLMVDPGVAPQLGTNGILNGETVWNGYKLTQNSPLIDQGFYVPQMGTSDFYGNQLYYGNAPDIGVHEYPQGVLNDPPTNLALNKTVTASNEHSTYTASKITDGVYSQSSRWAATTSTTPISLDINLGEEKVFNKVKITENIVKDWATPRIARLELQALVDGNYITFYTYSGVIGEGKELLFSDVATTNLRLLITELRADTSLYGSGQTSPSVVEVEVYKIPGQNTNTNLALLATPTASSTHSACPVTKINDGVYGQSSRWASNDSALPLYVDLDFGVKRIFNSVKLTENIVSGWATPRIQEFELQRWNGTGYETFYTYSGVVGENKEFTFAEQFSQKLRLKITALRPDTSTNSLGQTDPSICEFEVYMK